MLQAGMAIEGPGGSIYISDAANGRIRRVDPQGTIGTVVGTGTHGCAGDGGASTSAQLAWPSDIAFDRDGSLLIADTGTHAEGNCDAIRRVSPVPCPLAPGMTPDPLRCGGVITTVAQGALPPYQPPPGNGVSGGYVIWPQGVAAGADGSIYFTQAHALRRIPPDRLHHGDWRTTPGWDWTIAGHCVGGNLVGSGLVEVGFAGDGLTVPTLERWTASGTTTTMLAGPSSVAVDADRNIYFADSLNGCIRRVSSASVLNTVAGGGSILPVGDGVTATDAALLYPVGVALDPTGQTLYISDLERNIVWKMATPQPFNDGGLAIASEDGKELYVFDVSGRHLRTEDAITGKALLTFNYTAYGPGQLLTSILDAFGNVTTIERAADGTPQAIDAPFGQRTGLTLDNNGYLASFVRAAPPAQPSTEAVNLTTGASGLLATLKDPKGATYSFQYDGQGRLAQVVDPTLGSLGLSYQGITGGGYSVALTSAMNRDSKVQVTFLPSGGIQKTATDTAGLVTIGILKPDGSFTITSPDQTMVEIDKTPDPRLGAQSPYAKTVTVTTPVNHLAYSASSIRAEGINATDPLGLLSETDTFTVNNRTTTTTYDAAQHQVTSTSPEGRQSAVLLDSFGRLVQKQVPGFQPVNYAYDGKSRLQSMTQGTGSEQRTVTYAYNPQGFLDSITDPLQHVTHFQYDAVGRVLKTTLADQRQIQAAYDLDGNLTALTPPARPEHDFGFDAISELVAYTPPAAVPGNPATTYSYNTDHQLVTINRPDGQAVTFNYDNGPGGSQSSSCSPSCASGRLQSISMPDGTLALAYDPLTGRLASIVSPSGQTLSYKYDGPLTTEITAQGPAPGVIDLLYDTNFWVTSRTINGDLAGAVKFQYDRDGLTTQAADVQVYRDPHNGLLVGAQLFNVGDVITRTDLGELQHYEAGYSGSCSGQPPTAGCAKMLVDDYQRDQAGRVTQRIETTLDSLTASPVTHTYAYTYDLTRLTKVQRDGATWETYAYDDNGNRTSWTDVTGSGAAVYDSQDRLLGYADKTYTYTANGELLTKSQGGQTNSYSYDVLGNLRQVSLAGGVQINYLVDAANRRIGKRVNGTLVEGFLYQGGIAPLAELDGTGNIVSLFTYASGRRVPEEMVQGGVTYRLIADFLGSVRVVANAQTGQVVQRLDYDSFGRVILDSNPGFQPFGYAGGLYDYQTGLVRFGARDYDAEIGRWTTRDPVLFAGGDTLLYAYCANDPINGNDPSGLDQFIPIDDNSALYFDEITVRACDPDCTSYDILTKAGQMAEPVGDAVAIGLAAWGVAAGAAVAGPVAASAALRFAVHYPAATAATTAGIAGVNAGLQGLGGTGSTTVYRSMAADGTIQYVGITNDIARRAAEQMAEKGIALEEDGRSLSLRRQDRRASANRDPWPRQKRMLTAQ